MLYKTTRKREICMALYSLSSNQTDKSHINAMSYKEVV
jgi:hypothetical protein